MPDSPAPNWFERYATSRAATNQANAQHSTGPRTHAGKLRSSLNALTHGLTGGRTVLLPTEDPAAHQRHTQEFFDEYQPQGPTEKQLVQELIDTSWRLNRVPLIEANLLARAGDLAIVDAHRLIANLGIQSSRLSRRFQKALLSLRDIQTARRERSARDLKNAAALLELHNHKGLPWQPADHGFVFSKDQVQRHSDLLTRQNEARHIAYFRFEAQSGLSGAAGAR